MRIGELARRSGVGVETVRFYEREGLLSRPVRAEGRRREYGEEHVAQLRMIRVLVGLGFGLKQVLGWMEMRAAGDARCADVHARIHAELANIGLKRLMLDAREAQLRGLLQACPPSSPGARCRIVDVLQRPGSTRTGAPK